MNNKRIRDDEDMDDDEYLAGTTLGYSVKSLQINNFRVQLNKGIMDASYYSRIFEMMLDAGENDQITFFISSGGGRVDGLNVLLEGTRLTDAYTTAVLVGSAHSAASIFALNCDEVIVTDSADMLCHEVTYGTGGKGSDVYSHVLHTKRTSDKLLTETYSGFLDDKQLAALFAGTQIYLTAEEIRECLARKSAYMEAKFQAEQQALEAPPEPKPARKRKTPVEA